MNKTTYEKIHRALSHAMAEADDLPDEAFEQAFGSTREALRASLVVLSLDADAEARGAEVERLRAAMKRIADSEIYRLAQEFPPGADMVDVFAEVEAYAKAVLEGPEAEAKWLAERG